VVPQSPGIVADFTESELIARIQGVLPPRPDWMVVGIGDDAAVVEPARNALEALCVDSLVEGIHFDRAFTPAAAIGHRALAVNLSDLAAMGATPRLALLSLFLPSSLSVADFDAMIGGLVALANRHCLHVAGGDMARSPGPLILDVTVAGSVKRRRALLRSGAQPGDELYVTGAIGSAAAGLEMLQASVGTSSPEGDPGAQRYLFPEPRVRIGSLLGGNRAATACIDLSDGLADGIRQIAKASGVGAIIDAAAVPIEPTARAWFERSGRDPVSAAAAGGDDYELLFAVRPKSRGRLAAVRRGSDARLTRIGVCTADRAVLLRNEAGALQPITGGYSHFR
jgi:thiamine-monophosphate kinase